MAYVNVHSIPGVVVTVEYFWLGGSPVPTPSNPLSLAGGVYSLTGTADWAVATIKVTDYGGTVLPVNARITVTGFLVGGPYSGTLGLDDVPWPLSGTSVPPDVPYSGTHTGTMDLTDNLALIGHNASGSPDIQGLTSMIVELDGIFTTPDFWREHTGTGEFADRELRRLEQLVVVPPVFGQEFMPPTSECTTVNAPPGPSPCASLCGAGPGSGSEPEPPGSGRPPGPGSGQPPTFPLCWTTTATQNGVTRRFRCCRNSASDPGRCEPY